MGVVPGDRVAIAMRNYPEWMMAYWAVTAMGAVVVVGMNAWWVAHEMDFALQDSAPKVLIADRERLQRFAKFARTSRRCGDRRARRGRGPGLGLCLGGRDG
jgi:acyl-coenzyme A synthetase/AMP-(fatty) acid ligase